MLMKKIGIALLIGIIAGIIDVIPMVLQHLNWYANSSAFAHWVILGLLIPFVTWNLASWLKGIVLAILTAIPVIILTLENGLGSVLPILVASAVLGALVGVAGEKYVR
jgi:hypothetical protein